MVLKKACHAGTDTLWFESARPQKMEERRRSLITVE